MVPRAFEKSICLVFVVVVVVVVVFVSPRKEEEAKRNIIFQCLHSLFFFFFCFCFLSGVSFCVPLFICVVSSFQKKSIKKKKEREKTKTDFGQTKKRVKKRETTTTTLTRVENDDATTSHVGIFFFEETRVLPPLLYLIAPFCKRLLLPVSSFFCARCHCNCFYCNC